ncbi:acyl-CoA dehydrogenase family protein [Enemella sp. A6]|uniref:acyl-CoA dehydrogenase family protein n=1 Tax=Enemella sp. A6 TaxID=3440152 RepID=UPI003EB9C40D
MDFNRDESVQDVADLAREILTDRATVDQVRAIENTESRTDEKLWKSLTEAGLVGVALGEDAGGSDLGLHGMAALLEEQGRTVAPAPLWSAMVSALLVEQFGDDTQREQLPALAEGTARLTIALEEFGAQEPADPQTTARREGEQWVLTGEKAIVPTPAGAAGVLVSARVADQGTGLFLVEADGTGVAWEYTHTTTHDRAGNLTLTDAPATLLGQTDGVAVRRAITLSSLALAAIQVGVADGALTLAADYLREREQFGRPLGTFQAVQHQLADCWIDIDAMRVTLWEAITALENNEDSADRAVLVAKWWCDQGGLDVVHRVQHLHGGIGVDVDYPVHRNFLWGKQISGTLGGAAAALADLGELLAAEEVTS